MSYGLLVHEVAVDEVKLVAGVDFDRWLTIWMYCVRVAYGTVVVVVVVVVVMDLPLASVSIDGAVLPRLQPPHPVARFVTARDANLLLELEGIEEVGLAITRLTFLIHAQPLHKARDRVLVPLIFW